MNFNIFGKIIDKLSFLFFFKGGSKKITQYASGRDMVLIQQNIDNKPDEVVEKVEKLISEKKASTKNNVDIVLGTFIGIVKSAEKPRTRVHLEFAMKNNDDEPTVLRGAFIKINTGVVHFKMFFKSNDDGSRTPNMSENFPKIVNSKGADRLQIEFENIDEELIHKGLNNCEVVVLADNNKISIKRFQLNVDDAMIGVLKESQQSADSTKIPSIFQATIQTE